MPITAIGFTASIWNEYLAALPLSQMSEPRGRRVGDAKDGDAIQESMRASDL